MKKLDEMSLTERIRLYADGDPEHGLPAHGFDFSHEDAEAIMSALRIVWLLSRVDFVHNFQLERFDIRDFCIVTNGIIRIAKNFEKKYPIKAVFRLEDEKGEN